jgi:hypothetical protein
MSLKFHLYWCPKLSSINLCLFGDVNKCTTTRGQLTHSVYYYLKDLDRIHLACKGLTYGDRDQTLVINHEPSKALWNPKWNWLFLEPFKGCELSKNKVEWLDLTSQLWSTLKGLPFVKTVYTHLTIIM